MNSTISQSTVLAVCLSVHKGSRAVSFDQFKAVMPEKENALLAFQKFRNDPAQWLAMNRKETVLAVLEILPELPASES